MAVFRVTVRGEGLRVKFDDVEVPCGFYKNEYLWARHSDEAITKAYAAVLEGLRKRSTVNQGDLTRLKVEVDEVEALGLMGLLQRHGFVFYRLDSTDAKE